MIVIVEIKKYFRTSDLKKIKALELGVGPGYSSIPALLTEERIVLVAIDNERIMIEQAEEVLKEFIQNNQVKLIEADALAFLKKQKSESFDLFFSGFTLHNFELNYRQDCLVEIYRILKKGGLFINADKYALDDIEEHQETLDWQLNKFKEEYTKISRPDLIKEWTDHYLQDDKEGIKMIESISVSFMRSKGFRGIQVSCREKMDALLLALK